MTKTQELAIDGGTPVRDTLISYGRQSISPEDIACVTEVLKSDFLTTGPKVKEFEEVFAGMTGADDAVAVSSGTAALHTMMFGLGVGEGDEVIVPSMTFAATANSVAFTGGQPVFADCEADTLLISPEEVAKKITSKTRAVIAVDFAGQPADFAAIREVAKDRGIEVLADACQSLGAAEKGVRAGSLTPMAAFSLHPVKPITTGEGGMVTTSNPEWAERMRMFRNHGMTRDAAARQDAGSWFTEMVVLGYNYRLSDMQCALGISQISRLEGWTRRRQEIAARYDASFADLDEVRPLKTRPDVEHAHHLYIVRLDLESLTVGRKEVFDALRAENIGVNVHFIPVHLHPYYRDNHGTRAGDLPVTEDAYERILTLPLHVTMTDRDIDDVIEAVFKVTKAYRR